MQASLLNVFVRLSQKALDKSRGYGSPPSSLSETEDCGLSDAAFAKLLKEIDSFSVELTRQGSADVVPEQPVGLPKSCRSEVHETTFLNHPELVSMLG